MRFPNKETVERIRREYPAGARVELVRMEDVQAPPVGTKGTVLGVDDTGSLLMRWNTGSGLNVVYGEDIVKKLATVTTVCYGEKKVLDFTQGSRRLLPAGHCRDGRRGVRTLYHDLYKVGIGIGGVQR